MVAVSRSLLVFRVPCRAIVTMMRFARRTTSPDVQAQAVLHPIQERKNPYMSFSDIARPAVLLVAALALVSGLTACGGTGESAGADGSGGGGVDKASLLAKFKTEKDAQGVPEDAVNCLVDVMLKHGDPADLQDYIDGKVKVDDIKGLGPSNKESEEEGFKCVS